MKHIFIFVIATILYASSVAQTIMVRYDFRLKKEDGLYLRILHQAIAIEINDNGEITRSLAVHTNITDIKKEGTPMLSFIGIDSEPSFIDYKPMGLFKPQEELLSTREKEILILLSKGNTSAQISNLLNISKHTVNTHRQNMLQKSKCTKITELASRAMILGYI